MCLVYKMAFISTHKSNIWYIYRTKSICQQTPQFIYNRYNLMFFFGVCLPLVINMIREVCRLLLLLLKLLALPLLLKLSISMSCRSCQPRSCFSPDSCVGGIAGLTFETFDAFSEQLWINVLSSGVKIVWTQESKVGIFHLVVSSG